MERILLVMFFGYIFGTIVFGQQPGNNVEFQPLVSFDGVIDGITEWFTDSLKGGWLLFISLFFIWVTYRWLIKVLDHRTEEYMLEDDNQGQLKSETVGNAKTLSKEFLQDSIEAMNTEKRENECFEKRKLLSRNEKQNQDNALDYGECDERDESSNGY